MSRESSPTTSSLCNPARTPSPLSNNDDQLFASGGQVQRVKMIGPSGEQVTRVIKTSGAKTVTTTVRRVVVTGRTTTSDSSSGVSVTTSAILPSASTTTTTTSTSSSLLPASMTDNSEMPQIISTTGPQVVTTTFTCDGPPPKEFVEKMSAMSSFSPGMGTMETMPSGMGGRMAAAMTAESMSGTLATMPSGMGGRMAAAMTAESMSGTLATMPSSGHMVSAISRSQITSTTAVRSTVTKSDGTVHVSEQFSCSKEVQVMAMQQMKESEANFMQQRVQFRSIFSNVPLYPSALDSGALLSSIMGGDVPSWMNALAIEAAPSIPAFPPAEHGTSRPAIMPPPASSGHDAILEEQPSAATMEPTAVEIRGQRRPPTHDPRRPSVSPSICSTASSLAAAEDLGARLAMRGGPHRIAWREMPEVIESGKINQLEKKEVQLQEAMFEVITSEASYYQSLNVLVNHFYQAIEFDCENNKDCVLKPIEKHHLFSNILFILLASQNFLRDLEDRWVDQTPVVHEVCDLILDHAGSDNFEPYVTYLRNQSYQLEALQRLNREHDGFRAVLDRLETSPVSGKLTLQAFLAMPMQRLTRLKLLVEVILKLHDGLSKKDEQFTDHAKRAHVELKRLLTQSETDKTLMDKKARLLTISSLLEFSDNCKRISISDKELIKEGPLKATQDNRSSVLRKLSLKKQSSLYLILFRDLLMITKKKNNRFLVLDYCPREALCIRPCPCGSNSPSTQPRSNAELAGPANGNSAHFAASNPTMFALQLSQSQNGSFADVVLGCCDKAERDAWIQVLSTDAGVLRPPTAQSGKDDVAYDTGDCPRVVATRNHQPKSSAELEAVPGQQFDVKKKSGSVATK